MLEVGALHAFYGEAIALSGVNLRLDAGEIVCVVGPNGAGKSTLVNAIAGLHQATRGRIVMDGRDLARVAGHRVCEAGIAVVPEGRRLFPAMSVLENLELGAYRKAARSARNERLGWVYELFPRLAERPTQMAGSLSGGEQQMVAIGRALMASPRVLLMDEPSLGLAPVVVDEVFAAIGTINAAGVSVLLVEQNVDRALRLATRGYLLSEGRVVLEGTTTELGRSDLMRRTVLGL
ncbi:MAG: ABC transporter ATP-binding protein [Chloroflexota bacterium]